MKRAVTHSAVYAALVLAVTAGCFGYRVRQLSDLEPRRDQAVFAQWAQDLQRAEHFLPELRPGESWRSALERDRGSFLHHLTLRIYNQQVVALNLVQLGAYVALSKGIGDDYRSHVVISIVGSTLGLLALGAFPLWKSRGPRAQEASTGCDVRGFGVGLAAVLLAASSLYLHHYAAFGRHNFGVASLVLATALASRFLTDPSGRGLLGAVAGTVVAIYTHWTNLLLLPAATGLTILATREWPLARRLSLGVRYAALVALSVLPVALLALGSAGANAWIGHATSRDPAQAGVAAILQRAQGWFSAGAELFSPAGLVAGLVGLGLLWRTRRVRLPALLVIVHFLLWSALAGVADKWLRTYLYVLPLLGLGMAQVLTAAVPLAIRRGSNQRGGLRLLAGLTAIGLVLGHLALQLPGLVLDKAAERRLPAFWSQYRTGEGDLRLLVAEMQSLLPEGSVLLTWSYHLQQLYAVLREGEDDRVEVVPALLSMHRRYRAGQLDDYLQRRGIGLEPGRALYLAASHEVPDGELRRAVDEVLGEGFHQGTCFSLEAIRSWETEVPFYEGVSLFRLDPAPCRAENPPEKEAIQPQP